MAHRDHKSGPLNFCSKARLYLDMYYARNGHTVVCDHFIFKSGLRERSLPSVTVILTSNFVFIIRLTMPTRHTNHHLPGALGT